MAGGTFPVRGKNDHKIVIKFDFLFGFKLTSKLEDFVSPKENYGVILTFLIPLVLNLQKFKAAPMQFKKRCSTFLCHC